MTTILNSESTGVACVNTNRKFMLGVFKAPEEEGGMMREYVPAKLADNKILLSNDPEYAERVKGMGDSNTVNAMINGDWECLSSGGFADLWRSRFHVVDRLGTNIK